MKDTSFRTFTIPRADGRAPFKFAVHTLLDGTELWGMVYIMSMFRPQPPMPTYYNGIHNAYVKLGLRSEIERVLEPALQRSQQRKRFSLW